MRKAQDTIKIKEDVRIPGTNIILEAGDKIEVLREGQAKAGFDIALEGGEFSEFLRRVLKEYGLEIEILKKRGPTGWPYVVFSGSYSDLKRFADEEMGDDLEVFLL